MITRPGLVAYIVVASLALTTQVNAADPAKTGVSGRFGFGLEKGIVIPLHAQGDFAGPGLGLLGRIEYWTSPRMALSVNPGLLFRLPEWLPKFHGGGSGSNSTEFLLAGGAKYLITSPFDFHAQGGLNFRSLWDSSSDMETRIAFLAGCGYRISRSWSLGANLFLPNSLLRQAEENVEVNLLLTITHGF